MVMKRQQRSTMSYIVSSKIFLFGLVLGCAFFLLTRYALVPCSWPVDLTIPPDGEVQREDAGVIRSSTTDENLVLIGVMSAKEFLESRVVPSFETWATTVPGKVGSCLRSVVFSTSVKNTLKMKIKKYGLLSSLF